LWAIFSWITFAFNGYIYSYLHAINIEATPVKCNYWISCGCFVFIKKVSIILIAVKKAYSVNLYEDITSIIQSTIFDLSYCGMLWFVKTLLTLHIFSFLFKKFITFSEYWSLRIKFYIFFTSILITYVFLLIAIMSFLIRLTS
jgi:hypothetical protein